MSSAGCSPGGGGPTRRTGSRAGADVGVAVGIGVVFGSVITSVIVRFPFACSLWPDTLRAAARWLHRSAALVAAPLGHQKTVDPIRPTALVSALAALPPSLLPRPGHRSPVDSAAGRRAPVRHEGANEETHCRSDRSLLSGWLAGHQRAASAAVGG